MASRFEVGNRFYALLAIALFVIGVALTAARTVKQYQTPGPFDPSRQGMCDFHNGIYFPTRAVLEGISPYGADYAAANPVARQIPFFLPSVLVLHTPFVLLPLHTAEVLFFVFSVAVILAIGILVSSAVVSSSTRSASGSATNQTDSIKRPIRWDLAFAVAAALVFSRGGHITLFDGYFTFELILATYLSIHWGERRPWMSAIMLAIVASKPTYILPLGFLMLARGNVKAIIIGAILSIVSAGVPFAWLAYREGDGDMGRGIEVLRDDVETAQEIHRAQDDESPVFSWTRVDVLAVAAKWAGKDPKEATHLIVMAVILIPSMLILNRRRRQGVDDGLVGVTGGLILLTMLVSLYHQSYDTMLMVGPLAAILVKSPQTWAAVPAVWRLGLAGLWAIPLFNYVSTRMILGRLDPGVTAVRVLTSVNGVCLAVGLAILVVLVVQSKGSQTGS
ncbi:MAG: glycosyltransferase 87 family protein [Rubripirellula sp.]